MSNKVKKFKSFSVSDTSFGRSKMDRLLTKFQDTFGSWGDIEIESITFSKPDSPRDILVLFAYYVDIEEVKTYNNSEEVMKTIEGL